MMEPFGVFEYIEQFTQPVFTGPVSTLHPDSFWGFKQYNRCQCHVSIIVNCF